MSTPFGACLQASAHSTRPGFVVDAGIKAQLLDHPLALGGTAGNADHAAALELGDLAHGLADGTGRTRHHDRFAGLGHAHVHQAEVAGHAGHAQHVEPLRQRAGAQVDLGQAVAFDLVGGNGDVFLHAKGGAHVVTDCELVVFGGNDLAHPTCAHDFANAHWWDVALAFVHPAAHGGVQRQGQGLERDAALSRFGNRLGGVAPVGGFGQAHRSGGKANLVVDEVGKGHGNYSAVVSQGAQAASGLRGRRMVARSTCAGRCQGDSP
jgi:hypothetical protein